MQGGHCSVCTPTSALWQSPAALCRHAMLLPYLHHQTIYLYMQVKRLKLHSSPIKHLSFDTEAEYLASCGTENYVSVRVICSSAAVFKLQLCGTHGFYANCHGVNCVTSATGTSHTVSLLNWQGLSTVSLVAAVADQQLVHR